METLLSMIPNGTLLVAQHLDAVLSRVTMTSEDEISAIVSIVSCLRLEKDFFAMQYRQGLASRLLRYHASTAVCSKSCSCFRDRLVISKFRSTFGWGYCHQMECMVSDAQEEPLRTRLGSAEVTARVITTGSWPRYSQEDDILPCRLVFATATI